MTKCKLTSKSAVVNTAHHAGRDCMYHAFSYLHDSNISETFSVDENENEIKNQL